VTRIDRIGRRTVICMAAIALVAIVYAMQTERPLMIVIKSAIVSARIAPWSIRVER
jgi:hypothetical protein